MVESTQAVIVSIHCLAYNQEEYIRNTLEGFVMQKTKFKFEAIVHDDASTDGTAKIILEYAKKYPKIIKPILEKENLFSKHDGSLDRIMDAACRGKYIAYCEGDDYWIDPYKLQKQVDIMESDVKISLVHTAFQCVDQYGHSIDLPFYKKIMEKSRSGYMFETLLLEGNYIMTLTVMVRREMLDLKCYKNCKFKYDFARFLAASTIGKFYYLDEITSCYRKNPTSLVNTCLDGLLKKLSFIHDYFLASSLDDFFKAKYIKSHKKLIIHFVYNYQHGNKILRKCFYRHFWLMMIYLLFKIKNIFLKKMQ